MRVKLGIAVAAASSAFAVLLTWDGHARTYSRPGEENQNEARPGGLEGGIGAILAPEIITGRRQVPRDLHPAEAVVFQEATVPVTSNPSVEGLEQLLITDPSHFEATADTLAAWVATFDPSEAYPDLAREAWAADPEGCAQAWGVIQRRRALQEAVSLYGARQLERVSHGLSVRELRNDMAPVIVELAAWGTTPPLDETGQERLAREDRQIELMVGLLDRVSAETQITLWGHRSLSDADTPPAYTELLTYLSSPQVQRAAEWLHERVTPQ